MSSCDCYVTSGGTHEIDLHCELLAKQVVDSAVMINPSFLTKKNQSGTYARLTIYPTDKSELQSLVETRRNGMKVDGDDDDDEEATSDHKLYERCRVDIVRI